ncbi:hypothetical protein GCM10027516_22330 [Niabella aquatica]
MPQAYQDRANLSLYYIDSSQTAYFGVAYSGFKSLGQDVTATFEVANGLIDQYNIDNAYTGITYYPLPTDAYTISGLSTVLKAGTTSSEPLALTIVGTKLQLGKHYLMPIRLKSVSGGIFDSSLSLAYFKIDELTIRSRDITSQAKLSVNIDNDGGPNAKEGSNKLVDGDFVNTKFLTFNYAPTLYAQLEFPKPTIVGGYTITSGDDAQERDPRDWTMSGSNDGTTWTVFDTKANQSFDTRRQTRRFNTSNTTAYKYYRWNITAKAGSGNLFQCMEFRLLQFY